MLHSAELRLEPKQEATTIDEIDSITKEALDSLIKDGIVEVVGCNEYGELLYALTDFGRRYGKIILETEQSATFKN